MPFFGEEEHLQPTEDMSAEELQDWVDGLEASGVPVPENVRKRLARINELLATFVSNDYRSKAGVPTRFDEESERFANLEDRAAVNKAYGVIMGELPAGDKDWVDEALGKEPVYQRIGPDGAKRRLRHNSSTKSQYPDRGRKKK